MLPIEIKRYSIDVKPERKILYGIMYIVNFKKTHKNSESLENFCE
jgi:hypothetical protein